MPAEVSAPISILRDSRSVVALLRGSRQEILRNLSQPDSASGLSRKLGVPRQRLNYHLRALEKDGLVELVEERRRGNCVERLVRATARAFVISPETLGGLGAGAEKGLDRASAAFQVATAARTIQEVSTLDATAREAGKRLVTLTLDTEIRFADAASRADFAAELADALATLLVRHHSPGSSDGRSYRLTTFVHPLPEPVQSEGATPGSTATDRPTTSGEPR